MNLDIVQNKLVKEINVKIGGRLCLNNELVFIEFKRKESGFTFRFSSNKADYSKC